MQLHIYLFASVDPSDAAYYRWSLRIEQNQETYSLNRHWSGACKAQDDVVAIAELVLNDALAQVQTTLASKQAEPLF